MNDSAAQNSATIRDVVRRWYTLWWVYGFAGGFLFGVYPVFLHTRGLTQLEINSVLAVYFVAIFIAEVPTGAFADALGRRVSFIVGVILRSFAFLLYFFSYTYVAFILAETVDAIGTTFISGSIDAWGVDALDEAGYEEVKDPLFSRVAQLMSTAFTLAAIIGAYVASIDIALPWLLGAAGYAITGFVGARLMREDRARKAEPELRRVPSLVAEQIKVSLRYGVANRAVMYLSAAAAISMAAWSPYFLEWPILMTAGFGQAVWMVGWVYALLTLARVIGAEIVTRLSPSRDARPARASVSVAGAAVLLFAAGAAGGGPIITFALLFLMNVCTGAIQPLTMSWFNEHIDSSRRATLISFNSMLQTLGGSIGLLASGYVVDRAGIPIAWQLAGVIALGAIPLYLALRPRSPLEVASAQAAK